MIYTIKFSDLKNLVTKFSSSESFEPLSYYEDEVGLYIYKQINHSVFHSVVTFEELSNQGIDINSFKIEFLLNAIELLQPLATKPEVSLSISSN